MVAFALAGNINMNFASDPIGYNDQGRGRFILKTFGRIARSWNSLLFKHVTSQKFKKVYSDVFEATRIGKIRRPKGATFAWSTNSTYIKKPPFFDAFLVEEAGAKEIKNARVFGLFGDFITTDHISPAGMIGKTRRRDNI